MPRKQTIKNNSKPVSVKISPEINNTSSQGIAPVSSDVKNIRESASTSGLLIQGLNESIEEIRKENSVMIKGIEQEKKDLKKELEAQKINVIEVIGVFISIFTFISVDIQIFRDNNNPFILIGFILVLLGALAVFNLLLKIILEKDTSFSRSENYDGIANIIPRVLYGGTIETQPELFKTSTWTVGCRLWLFSVSCILTGIVLVIIGTLFIGTTKDEKESAIQINVNDHIDRIEYEKLVGRLESLEEQDRDMIDKQSSLEKLVNSSQEKQE